jgi:hypothetical protein
LAKPGLKKEAIRLRVEGRLSYDEILAQIPVARSSLSGWLRAYPLTEAEMRGRRKQNAPSPDFRRKDRGEESAISKLVRGLGVSQTTTWKGRVAEAAVLLRLVLHGFEPMRAVFEGDSVDWFVRVTPSRIVRLQVRWAGQPRYGLPCIELRRKGTSRRKFGADVIDYFVGFNFFTDTAYVFSWDEVKTQSAVTVRPDAAERWDKLRGVAQSG